MRLSTWIKRIVIIIIIIYCILSFPHLIDYYKWDISLSNNTTKTITVELSINTAIMKINNIHIAEFSGEYNEVPSILTINNSFHEYCIDQIYFSFTTNTKRIINTIQYLKFWTKFPSIKCLIVFEQRDFETSNINVTDYLIRGGIPCKIRISNVTRYEERYFELIHYAWNNQEITPRKRIEWFALGDDDTLWFINNLLYTLRQYNSSNKIYLGDISDEKIQIIKHGDSFAYGGGGILLSRPLAYLFTQYFQRCGRSIYVGGDGMLGRCVKDLLNVTLTRNSHFHQMDHKGDMTGLFESGIDGLVSLHHMLSWWKPFPNGHSDKLNETIYLLEFADKIFNRDFLKRYVHYNLKTNQTVLLTLGYSFHIYNRILSYEELTQIEKTWCCTEIVGRKFRSKEQNQTIWYFRDLRIKNFQYEIIYENVNEIPDYSIHIKLIL